MNSEAPDTESGGRQVEKLVLSASKVSLDIRATVRAIVLDATLKAFDKRRQILSVVLSVLKDGGHFCRTGDGRGFYFAKSDRRLYDLDQQAFVHVLTAVSGLSPTEGEFRFVHAMLRADAAQSKPVEINSFAYFSPDRGVLAVSDGGPGVWIRERGDTWHHVWNGEQGLLFFTEPDAALWEPEFDATPEALDWFLAQIPFAPHEELTVEDQRAAYLTVLLQLFFPCFKRTCVIPAFLGPQGSGKSTAMRITGRFLIGPQFDVTGLRGDKEDAFVVAVTNRLVCGLDNADSRIKWLEDDLATYATRQRYQLRKLYTTNEEVSYLPRAFLMLSSRDPHFRRPDVAQRLLPFHFEQLAEYLDEAAIFDGLEKRRTAIWGALLNRLAELADALPAVKSPALKFRMADFAAFGWRIFRAAGKESDWEKLLHRFEKAQTQFSGEGDGLIEALRILMEQNGKVGPIEVGDLFRQCGAVAADRGLPLPRTAQGFGQKLTNMRRVIELELNASFAEERGHQNRRTITVTAKTGK
ncbi:hypothetical protein [Candidatus Binatus sp.]|uniref:hypothetical protein n=1 Tax=Candidatus Binatus sp. TaxID=2811406 RepID=UPI003BB20BD6